MNDHYRVLPHRDIIQISAPRDYGAMYVYLHKPCGVSLKEVDVKEANWCPHCAAVINKAAQKRKAALFEGGDGGRP